MSQNRTMGSLASVLALLTGLSTTALAQTPPAGAAPERPKIRLSGEETKTPAEEPAKPAPEKSEAEAPSDAKKSAPAASEPAGDSDEDAQVVETVDSVAGSEPAAGLGPAAAAADAPEDDEKELGQPRVIDISADDEEQMDPADLPPEEPKIPPSQLPFTYHLNHVDVHGGFRFVGTYDEELEPFLVDPVMVDLYVRGGVAFGLTDRIAIAPSLELGGASSSSNVRGIATQINKMHVSLGVEGRYHFMHRMFGYARVAPGFEFVGATFGLEDTSSELSTGDFPGSVGFQFDAALGASMRLFGPNDGRERKPRLWFFAEGGYRASTKHELSLSVNEDYGPRRAASLDLAPLHLSGGFFSTGLMASF